MMQLPEPKDVKWGEHTMDYGHQHALSMTAGSLHRAVRFKGGSADMPRSLAQQVLLKWYWRKLGAA